MALSSYGMDEAGLMEPLEDLPDATPRSSISVSQFLFGGQALS